MNALQPDSKAIFLDALDCNTADELNRLLEHACGPDTDLRTSVERLLRAHRDAGGFLGGAGGLDVVRDQPIALPPGTHIGPYLLREQIGEGGMGLVFVADQEQPVRRRVALKVVKPGMDTRQVLARFEAERQALALMDHPNIARVLDAGATESGRPYFVMELVRGVPITDYCDGARLTARQRLELFLAVCRAIQHAHQKGVIHRDIKPSNLLVTLYDSHPVPKVIDFGIAKAVGTAFADHSVYTGFAQLVGTPMYMSPEQAEMTAQDVDTRADVYALGVVLYELLTGTTPFDGETLRQAGFDEMRRIIREDEPARPSHRVTTMSAEKQSTVSGRRGVDNRQLGRQLQGGLDWVVMTCLEKDRTRRYESAGALAADIERYLRDEPVTACPPSSAYRLRTFARRNRRALATLGVIAAALLAATAVSVWQAVKARDAQNQAEIERDLAKTAQRETAAAEKRASTEAAIASAVNEFLQNDLLRQANGSPQVEDKLGGSLYLTVKEALDRAATKINERFQDQPLVEAEIREAIGEAYASLSCADLAVPHFERAVALHRACLGANHSSTLTSMQRLATSYAKVGRAQDAIVLLEKVLEGESRLLGSDNPAKLSCLSHLADACRIAGKWDRAIPLAEQLVDERKSAHGPVHPETIGAMHMLALIYLEAGFLDTSIALHEKTLAIYEATQLTNIWAMRTYSRALQGAGRLGDADSQLRKALELARLPSDRRARERGIATTQTILGLNLLLQGKYEEAEAVSREALGTLELEVADSWAHFHAMSLVGDALLGQQRYADAEPFLVRGYEGMKLRERFMDAGFKHWLTKAGDRIICYYEATNQPEKTRRWVEKLSPMK